MLVREGEGLPGRFLADVSDLDGITEGSEKEVQVIVGQADVGHGLPGVGAGAMGQTACRPSFVRVSV